MRLTHQLTVNRRYLVSGDLRLSFSLSVICLSSVCYLSACVLSLCLCLYLSLCQAVLAFLIFCPSILSVSPLLSYSLSYLLFSFSTLLVHVWFCLQSLWCLIMVSRHVQVCYAMATHYTSLPGGTKLFLWIDFALHKWALSKSLFTTLYTLMYTRLWLSDWNIFRVNRLTFMLYRLHNVQTVITLYCSVSASR